MESEVGCIWGQHDMMEEVAGLENSVLWGSLCQFRSSSFKKSTAISIKSYNIHSLEAEQNCNNKYVIRTQ